jgi:hypothetical protein
LVPVTAVIEMGVAWTFSARFCAVTITSSNCEPAAGVVSAAMSGVARAIPAISAIIDDVVCLFFTCFVSPFAKSISSRWRDLLFSSEAYSPTSSTFRTGPSS